MATEVTHAPLRVQEARTSVCLFPDVTCMGGAVSFHFSFFGNPTLPRLCYAFVVPTLSLSVSVGAVLCPWLPGSPQAVPMCTSGRCQRAHENGQGHVAQESHATFLGRLRFSNLPS